MAPAKREYDDMMFDYDPVFEIDIITHTSFDGRPNKRCKDAAVDLTKYVVPSDDEFDAIVPSVEQLEFTVRDDVAALGAKNPFITEPARPGASRQPSLDMLAPAFDDWSSDSDDGGYSTMFNSPAHVLDTQFDVPFVDPALADAAESLLETVDSTVAVHDVVAALSDSCASSRASSMEPEELRAQLELAEDDDTPPAQMVTKTGKPVNPTRWAHNSTERKRRLEIRKLFGGLRDLFPEIAGDDKVSNITTLNRAIDHVEELKQAIAQQEEDLAAMRERNVLLRQRAEEALARQKADEDVPPEAAAVLGGNADPELRKTLPAALRQLLDHNSRGPVEKAPLQRRRIKAVLA